MPITESMRLFDRIVRRRERLTDSERRDLFMVMIADTSDRYALLHLGEARRALGLERGDRPTEGGTLRQEHGLSGEQLGVGFAFNKAGRNAP